MKASAPDPDRPYYVAFSGGGDSTALVAAIMFSGDSYVNALIVDHRARPGSEQDTQRAERNARALRAFPHIRAVDQKGKSPPFGQSALRRMRHLALVGLYGELVRNPRTGVIFVGHTLDDACEARLMGTGLPLPMSVSPVWPEGGHVMLVRPLLNTRRADIRDFLILKGIPWIDDPSNVSKRFKRTAARAELAEMSPVRRAFLEADVRLRIATRIELDAQVSDALIRSRVSSPMAEEFGASVAMHRWDVLAGLPDRHRYHALSRLAAAYGGQEAIPLRGPTANVDLEVFGERARSTLGKALFGHAKLDGEDVLVVGRRPTRSGSAWWLVSNESDVDGRLSVLKASRFKAIEVHQAGDLDTLDPAAKELLGRVPEPWRRAVLLPVRSNKCGRLWSSLKDENGITHHPYPEERLESLLPKQPSWWSGN
jgi:tRNA(Ile)-lysidine synthetase-like protein